MPSIRMIICTLTFLISNTINGFAQQPDFSGTWSLDTEHSHKSEETNLTGLSEIGPPETIHITQPANGALIIESPIRNSQARFYVPGEKTSTPVLLGNVSTITMDSRWEGKTLVSEGERTSSSEAVISIKEMFQLDSEGQTLEVQIEIEDNQGKNKSVLSYRRTARLESCENWPVPCKDRPSSNR